MAKALFTNNASGTLAAAIVSTGATSLVLTAGQGALFPAPSGGNWFMATIIDVSNNKEIVKVTANAADTFTIQRAQEGTTALTFASACKVELRPTAGSLNTFLAAGNDLSDLNSAATARTNLGLVIGTNVPSPTGSGASGTWGINITGNAATATSATTAGNITAYTINQSVGTGNSPSFAGLTLTSGGLSVTGGISCTGNISATGEITAYASDDRLKDRFEEVSGALDKICSLPIFYYEMNVLARELGLSGGRRIGTSAQSLKRVAPEMIRPAPINREGMDYITYQDQQLIPLVIAAIQELRREMRGRA